MKDTKKRSQSAGAPGVIEIAGWGIGEANERFVELAFSDGEKDVVYLLRYDDHRQLRDGIGAMNKLGAHLVASATVNDLISRIQEAIPASDPFTVVTRPGFANNQFVLPSGEVIAAPDDTPVAVSLVGVPSQIGARFRTRRSSKALDEFDELSRGNSRLLLARTLAYVGPMSAIIRVQPAIVQLWGPGGEAKTSTGAAMTSEWGRDRNPLYAECYGAGETWAQTANNLDVILRSYNQTFLFLDETRQTPNGRTARGDFVMDATMKITGSVSKGRMTEESRAVSFNCVLSTSNVPLTKFLQEAGLGADPAYLDRMFDIPPPAGGHGMFEDLHGHADVASFCKALKEVTARHYGVGARNFLRQLVVRCGDRSSRAKLIEYFKDRRAAYLEKSVSIVAPGRDLARVHGLFADFYATSRVARRFGVLRFERQELLDAIFKCEADNVAFVAEFFAQTETDEGLLQRLRSYVAEKSGEFLITTTKKAGDDLERCPGWLDKREDGDEYLFTQKTMERIAGGAHQAERLKRVLHNRQAIRTTGAGPNVRFVLKRTIGRLSGTDRPYVIAVLPEKV